MFTGVRFSLSLGQKRWRSGIHCRTTSKMYMFMRTTSSPSVNTQTKFPGIQKKWIQPGSIALHKVEKLLYNKRVLKDIEKLSHNFQTSSLEAFHSLILRFAPKNVIFPFIGMLCRLYLAAMHYNENANREQATTTEGQAVYKIVFPKSKKGECTAKPVKIEPTYIFVDPKPYAEELHAIPIPPPLSSQYEKPSKEEVIAQRVSRFSRGVAGTQHTVPLDQETVDGSG
ncbi:uncharacterized protein LOC132155140 isoform X2 [Carassius carassius]|uniref:uncharacterized protein LOC132155140 isoform X2 n=1 Tax=Carassius carassius TaxID=217509 RepID=UPI002869090F|nr:uncharacterized protein LOC132155140 isoform X2 [Carassius carassius]